MLDRPARLSGHGIPSDQLALVEGLDRLQLRGVIRKGVGEEVGAEVPGARAILEVLHPGISEGGRVGWNIDKSFLRIERHRMPVVGAQRARKRHGGCVLVPCALHLDWPSSLKVHPLGPGDGRVRRGRDQLTGRAVDDIEEAVLRRLHEDLAGLSAHREVGKDHVLGGCVVPAFARSGLIVPDVFACVGPQGQDG